MPSEIKRTALELEVLRDSIDQFSSNFRGVTYEQGIIETLDWILGDSDITPAEQ